LEILVKPTEIQKNIEKNHKRQKIGKWFDKNEAKSKLRLLGGMKQETSGLQS
jgi:hypothetical protein